ncbi:MAG: TIGR02281 family clan AA aspartic protease [Alphaproteobacteria bacterium]|nr:TIGR02281 family clan AA aspartic protease [Alphaproteobacteria bacterium]
MIFALGNVALILAALVLFFLADPSTFFWFLEPSHSTYAFFGLLVALFGAAEWLNAQRWETPMRLMTSWVTTAVAIAILGLQMFNTVDLSALTAPFGQQAQQSAKAQPPKRTKKRTKRSAAIEQATTYGEVEIRAARNGNFYTIAGINGTSIKVLVDTGATYVSLTYEDAEALALDPLNLEYSIRLRTANGISHGAPVELDEVTIGGITVNNVQGVVGQKGAKSITLLGMSYLSRAGGFKIVGDRMILGE